MAGNSKIASMGKMPLAAKIATFYLQNSHIIHKNSNIYLPHGHTVCFSHFWIWNYGFLNLADLLSHSHYP